MRFSVEYSADEDNATAAAAGGNEMFRRALSSIRPLGGAAGRASPDGHRPRLPVELQRAARRAETARRTCGVLPLRPPPTAALSGFSLAVVQPARCTRLHWEELKLELKMSSG